MASYEETCSPVLSTIKKAVLFWPKDTDFYYSVKISSNVLPTNISKIDFYVVTAKPTCSVVFWKKPVHQFLVLPEFSEKSKGVVLKTR
jgi:hypothetical protein